MTATFNPKEIRIASHSVRNDVGREFLTIDCPDGWDDVKKIKDRILQFEGKRFAFTGWNSDTNQAYFAKPIGMDCEYAKIVKN